jgi:hypothetical protein
VTIKIAAQFTKETRELNGLNAIEKDMLDNPHDEWYIVARVVNAHSGINHLDGDSKDARAHLAHIEPLWGDDETAAKELLSKAYKARTVSSVPKADATLFDDAAGGDAEDEPVSERTPDAWIDPAAN